jgi:hypothetical protein
MKGIQTSIRIIAFIKLIQRKHDGGLEKDVAFRRMKNFHTFDKF